MRTSAEHTTNTPHRAHPGQTGVCGAHEDTFTRLSRMLKIAHLCAILGLITVVALTALWVSDQHTQLARASAKALVSSAVMGLEERVKTVAGDYSYWDEVHDAVQSDDRAWLHSSIGTAATETGTVEAIVLSTRDGSENYGWVQNGPETAAADILARPQLLALLARIQDTPIDPASVIHSYKWIDGALWLFAVARILPYEGYASLDDATLYRQIHGIRLTPERLDTLGQSVLISGLNLRRDPPQPGQGHALMGSGGQAIAWLMWKKPAPGVRILSRIALPLTAALAVAGVAGWLLSRLGVRAARRLEHALDAATAADRAKTDFLANVSHELRTPMNGVVNLVEMVRETDLDEDQTEMLDMIADAANEHMELIEQLLDFGSIDAGARTKRTDLFALKATVAETCIALQPVAEKKGLTLVLDLDALGDYTVLGDRLAIRQILTNLLGNAIKFTETGKVICEARARVQDQALAIALTVRDTGPGIPADKLDTIFERFSQVDTSTTRQAEGVGLGLSISKGLAETIGADITVTSDLGQGSAFTLTLTLEIVAERGDNPLAAE
ncbi:MAG: ATP-binding protein [Pseudomonadota bacterium]